MCYVLLINQTHSYTERCRVGGDGSQNRCVLGVPRCGVPVCLRERVALPDLRGFLAAESVTRLVHVIPALMRRTRMLSHALSSLMQNTYRFAVHICYTLARAVCGIAVAAIRLASSALANATSIPRRSRPLDRCTRSVLG